MSLELKPVILDQPQINEFYENYGAGDNVIIDGVDKYMPIEEIIARDVVSKSVVQSPGLFTYDTLKDGTASFFDQVPAFKAQTPGQRRFKTNDEIINFLARTSQGEELEFGTMLEGFKRDILPQGLSLTGAVTGAKLSSQAAKNVPSVIGKFGTVVGGTVLGAFGGWEGGELLTSQLFGDEKTILPGTRKAYAAGKTAAGAFAWLPTPFLISKNVDFGSAKYLDNLVETLKKGPLTPADYKNKDLVKSLAKGKGPNVIRLINGIEKMLTSSKKFATDRPFSTLAVEGMVGVSQTGFGGYAEQTQPGEALPRVGYELGGSIVPGVAGTLLIDRIGAIKDALVNMFGRAKAAKDKGLYTSAKEGISFLKEKREMAGAKKILELLEEQGEIDPSYFKDQTKFNALIEKLSEVGGKLDPSVQLTAGLKADSPVLMAIEASLAQTNRGLGKQQKSAMSQQGTALRNVILALIKTGDKGAIKEAMKLSEALFSDALTHRLHNATKLVLDSFETVKGKDPASNAELGETLFKMIQAQFVFGRKQEKDLWNKVRSVNLENFKNDAGQEVPLPNFIQVFKDEFAGPDNPKEYREFFAKNLRPLFAFANRKSRELGYGDIIDPKLLDETAAAGPDLSKFDQNIDSFLARGSLKGRTDNLVLNMVNEQLRYLNLPEVGKDEIDKLKDVNTFSRDDLLRIQSHFVEGNNKPQKYGEGEIAKKNRDARMFQYNTAKSIFKDLLRKLDATPKGAVADEAEEATGTITSKELIKMRSLALSLQRGLSGNNGNSKAAGFAGKFAKAILDDLDSYEEGLNVDYDAARAYSKAFNKVYTNTFAGDVLQKTSTGVIKNNPETLADKLFSGSADATNLRVKQIFNLGKFADENNLEGAADLPNSVTGVLTKILRNAKAAALDPTTGNLNEKALARWMETNKDLLDSQAFQGLRDDLTDFNTARVLLSNVKDKNKNLQKKLDNQLFFKNVSGGKSAESPVITAGEAIVGRNPTRDIRNLARIANASSDPKKALDGLYTSILEYAMTKAGGTSQSFSPRAFYDTVFSEMPKALRSTNLAELMIKNGIATEKQMNGVKRFVTELVKFEAMEAAGKFGIGDLADDVNGVLGFYLKISGASIGQAIAAKMPLPGSRGMGTGLIESQAGVRIMENIFRDVPQSMKIDVMAELMADPVRLSQMLQKARTKEEAKQIGDALIGWMYSSGFKPLKRITPTVIREVDEEVTGPEFQEQSSVQPNQEGSPTTQIGQGLSSGVNNRLAAKVGTPPPAASIDRNKFASLFPDDITSGLINAQQPTQFMQYGGVAGDPSYDMGLETAPVSVQEAIQSALQDTGSNNDNTPREAARLPSSLKPRPQGRRSTGITSINLPGYAGEIARNLQNFVTNFSPSISMPEGGGIKIGGIIPFQDGGFVDDYGDPSDYGMTQEDFDFATNVGQQTGGFGDDNTAQSIANYIAQPQVGLNRSNIRGMANFDPQYAAALSISRGLDPTNNPSYGISGLGVSNQPMIGGLPVPSNLRPQIEGEIDGKKVMFNSRGEQVLQQYLPGIVEQAMDMGIMGLFRKAGDYASGKFSKLFGNNIINPQQIKRTDIQ